MGTLNNFAVAGKCLLAVNGEPVLLFVAIFFGSMTAAAALSGLGMERKGKPLAPFQRFWISFRNWNQEKGQKGGERNDV